MADLTLPAWLVGDQQISGREQGFNERADVIVAADGTDLNDFYDEVLKTIRMRNESKNKLINRLSYAVTGAITSVTVPSKLAFEEASEYGQPVGGRAGGIRQFRGYDFTFYDLAFRYTWMFLAEADRAQLEMQHNLALEADQTLVFNRVMKTIYNPINVQGVGDKNEPTTVFKFYNADGEVPPAVGTFTHSGTHSHYLTSGGAQITSANVDTMMDELNHHGYNLQGGYTLVLLVAKQEADRIRAFRTSSGARYDFVPNASLYEGKIWVPNNGQYVGGPQGTVPGEIGTYGAFHVVEDMNIPTGYPFAFASGGNDNLNNPVGIRQHANPAYRGLKIIPGQRSDYPLVDSFYRRGFGTGIRHRGAGVVMQVTTNGSYTVPTIYA